MLGERKKEEVFKHFFSTKYKNKQNKKKQKRCFVVDDSVKKYIAEALRRNHPVEDIIQKLVDNGHNEETVRTRVKSTVQDRINQLQQTETDLTPQRNLFEIAVSFLIRGVIGVVAAWSLYQVIIAV